MADKVYRDPAIYETVVKKFADMPHVKIIRGFVPDTFKIAFRNESRSCISILIRQPPRSPRLSTFLIAS